MPADLLQKLSDEELLKLASWTRDRLQTYQILVEEAQKDYAPLRLEVARRGLFRQLMGETPSE